MDNVYKVSTGGTIRAAVQVLRGEKKDALFLAGAHVSEVISDPFVANHFIDQIRRTLTTGWPSDILLIVQVKDKEVLRTTTIEKAGTDRVLMFVRPAGI